ncbi:hypothetical protein QPK13_13355 [Photorhabdus tasmaniensis]
MSTNFIRIINLTSKKLHIVEGEYNKYYDVNEKTTLNNIKIAAPWVGGAHEKYKLISITIEDEDEEDIFLFLDYYSGNDQIKFNRGTFDYDNAKNVAGRSSGGGDRVLYFEDKLEELGYKVTFKIL